MRIYDCCIMSHELDLLEARFNILQDAVDYFVVVESNTTFSGNPKPQWLPLHQRRFHEFMSRIIYVSMKNMPMLVPNRWHREAAQRDAVARGLKLAEPGDLVLVSDVDEIPKPEYVAWAATQQYSAASLKTYYYNLESVSVQYLVGTTSMKWDTTLSPNELRHRRHEWPLYKDGAWHFSFFGGIDAIQHKIRTFSHAEYDTDQWLDGKRIERNIQSGIDPFERAEYPIRHEPLNDSLPAYLLNNLEKYPSWLPEKSALSSVTTAPT